MHKVGLSLSMLYIYIHYDDLNSYGALLFFGEKITIGVYGKDDQNGNIAICDDIMRCICIEYLVCEIILEFRLFFWD